MLYLVIWLLCGLVAAAIYRNKRRSWGIAFLGGLLLGPLGVILALITPAVPPERAYVCTKCHKASPYQSTICPYCSGYAEPR